MSEEQLSLSQNNFSQSIPPSAFYTGTNGVKVRLSFGFLLNLVHVSIDIVQVPPALDLYGEFGEFQQQNHHHEPQQQALEAGL